MAPKEAGSVQGQGVHELLELCRQDIVRQLAQPRPEAGEGDSLMAMCREHLLKELPLAKAAFEVDARQTSVLGQQELRRKLRDELLEYLSDRPEKPSLVPQVPEEQLELYRRCREELLATLRGPSPASVAGGLCEQLAQQQRRRGSGSCGTGLSPCELFKAFASARGPRAVLSALDGLLAAAAASGVDAIGAAAPHERLRKLPLPWHAQRVWQLLDGKAKRGDRPAGAAAPLRALVVGTGPVGLRLAIELRAAGHEVTVIDKRREFSRLNRVHLWPWCKDDLVSLGAKIFDPPGSGFGADADYCHIAIWELQSLLLKFAALQGVRLVLGCELLGLERPVEQSGGGWLARLGSEEGSAREPFQVLVGADGADSVVARLPEVSAGLGRISSGLRRGCAIGLTANLRGAPQPAARQFSWARQFAEERFANLEAETGVSLENIVHYQSGAHHYLVMTPTPASLARAGVLVDAHARDLVAAGNVRRDRARAVAALAATHFGVEGISLGARDTSEGALAFEDPPNDVAIFDFSGSQRAQRSCAFLRAHDGPTAMVCLVGDALLEPFWPEGLGIMRGFHSALDAVAATNAFASAGAEDAERVASSCYSVLKCVNSASASGLLMPDTRRYSVDPETRYRWL